MSILNSAKHRYSAKAFIPERKISDEDIHTLQAVVQLSPSSINSQPWHIILAGSDSAKKKIAAAAQGQYSFNEQKLLDASHIMVFCARSDINAAYFERLLAKERADGRIVNSDVEEKIVGVRNAFFASVSDTPQALKNWIEKQLYIALGNVLLAAAAMNIDSVPIEGFDAAILDKELGLHDKPYYSVVMAAFGYHSEGDFNAGLPKSRFELVDIFTEI